MDFLDRENEKERTRDLPRGLRLEQSDYPQITCECQRNHWARRNEDMHLLHHPRCPDYRPSPPAEPKCENCGHEKYKHYDDSPKCGQVGCPCDGYRPAESEGRRKPCSCLGSCKGAEGLSERYYCSLTPPTPSPESVEDRAKAFVAREGRIPEGLSELELEAFLFYDPEPRWRDEFHAHDFAQRAAPFAEQYAAKHLERQTPAIIERFVEEVSKEADRLRQAARYSESFVGAFYPAATQRVKARRSGGEE